MTDKKWKDAFGAPTQGFENRVKDTVKRLETSQKPVRRPRMALATAMALILLTGTALAFSNLGLLDMLAHNLRNYLQPGAQELVQTQPEQSAVQPAGTIFTVEEAVNDGEQIYLLVRVKAADASQTLLMDDNAEAAWGHDWWKHYDESEGERFSALAQRTERALVQVGCLQLAAGEQALMQNAYSVHYEGEDVLYALTFQGVQNDFDGSLSLFAIDLYAQGENRSFGELNLRIPMTDSGVMHTTQTPVILPAMGGVLQAFTVKQTPIATYVCVEYTLSPEATDLQHLNFRDGIWYRWLYAEGEPVEDGNQSQTLAEKDGKVTLQTAYRAFDTLPEKMTLEFFNGMTKERFDTITLSLTKEENQP